MCTTMVKQYLRKNFWHPMTYIVFKIARNLEDKLSDCQTKKLTDVIG